MTEIVVKQMVVDGVRSLVRSAGPETASEAVVFLHGNPGSSEDWLFLLRDVAAFARVIAPDMPGYGHAARPWKFDYTISGYARHLAGLLEQLAVRRVHLVLHDFGGPWGLQWAAQHSDQVASITLLNIGLMPGYRWHKIARMWRRPIIGELFIFLTSRRAFRDGINSENPKPFPNEFVERMAATMDVRHKLAVLALYRASDLDKWSREVGPLLKSLDLPALVLWGAEDPALPASFAHVQRDYFRCETHVLDHCGHWPFADDPDRLRELIVPFLEREAGARAHMAHAE